MRYNYKELNLSTFEIDYYERCLWDILCKNSIFSSSIVEINTICPRLDLFLRLPDVRSLNDINLIKSFHFLLVLFFGLNLNFELKHLKKTKVGGNPNKILSESFTAYFFNSIFSNSTVFSQFTFLMFYLLPFLKSKQSSFEFYKNKGKLIFILPDLNNLVTGAGSLSLYYDYFDWESVILSFEFFSADTSFKINRMCYCFKIL
jgi:hypothetical protein